MMSTRRKGKFAGVKAGFTSGTSRQAEEAISDLTNGKLNEVFNEVFEASKSRNLLPCGS